MALGGLVWTNFSMTAVYTLRGKIRSALYAMAWWMGGPPAPLSSTAVELLWLWSRLLRWLLVAQVEKWKRKLVPKEQRDLDVALLPQRHGLAHSCTRCILEPRGAGAQREGEVRRKGGVGDSPKPKHYTIT